MSASNLVRRRPKFTQFFSFNAELNAFNNAFTACRYLYLIQRYLRSNSKVFVKRIKFCTFLPSQILKAGSGASKIVLALTLQTRVASSAKVWSGYIL